MKCARVVGGLAALCALLAPGVAHAQIFSVYKPPSTREATRPGDKEAKFRRIQIGTFLALWDAPPADIRALGVFTIPTIPGSPTLPAEADVDLDASPLLTADFFITRNISVGGWWNPVSGSATARFILPPGFTVAPGSTKFNFTDNFYDFHGTYYFPEMTGLIGKITRGMSIQAGYSIQNLDLDIQPGALVPIAFVDPNAVGGRSGDFGTTLTSPNVWITKSFDLGNPLRSKKPVSLFISGGKYFDSDFSQAWNIMGGATVKLRENLDLSASYWRVLPRGNSVIGSDLDDQTRISVGLTARY
jgi:hypothetical protein